MAIPPEDLKVESWPPRNPSGQQVGDQSGVKVTHLPTGIAAFVNIGRSQMKNRNIAMDMILSALTHKDFR